MTITTYIDQFQDELRVQQIGEKFHFEIDVPGVELGEVDNSLCFDRSTLTKLHAHLGELLGLTFPRVTSPKTLSNVSQDIPGHRPGSQAMRPISPELAAARYNPQLTDLVEKPDTSGGASRRWDVV